MKYLEFTFRTSPCTEVVNDVLSAILGDAGFESFVEQEGGIAAYIQKDLYDETTVKAAIDEFPLPDTQIEYTFTEAEDKDWNEEWEKNFFQPIVIGDRCVIHSTFHHDVPQTEYDIVINPQMAFGTGHHETIPRNAGLTGDRVSIHPETFDHLIHLLLLIRVKGQMSQADMILVVSLSNILPLHDLQGRATLERDEIRGESFFRIHIFLITLTIKILYIEIP